MKNIDIQGFKSRRVRTLINYVNYMYTDEIQPEEDMMFDFFNNYLPEAICIINELPNKNIKNINKVKFISKNKSEIENNIQEMIKSVKSKIQLTGCDTSFDVFSEEYEKIIDSEEYYLINNVNSGIYNICYLLVSVDKVMNDSYNILDSSEIKYHENTISLLNKMINDLIFINFGISSFIMNINRNNFIFSKHYNVQPDIYKALINQKNLESMFMYIDENNLQDSNDEYYPISTLLLGFDLELIRQKLIILKFMISFICIQHSIEYPGYIRDIANIFIDIFQEIMYCGSIQKIFVQQKILDKNKIVNKRVSSDGTTRINIIFTIDNGDVFTLRIDFPHEDQEKLHINLEELVNGSIRGIGYPIDLTRENKVELYDLCKTYYNSLFFELNDYIWFRSNFMSKLKKTDIEQCNKDKLEKIFSNSCHQEIPIEKNITESQLLEFFDELQEYLLDFNIPKTLYISFGRIDEVIIRTINKIKYTQDVIEKTLDFWQENLQEEIKIKEILWGIYHDIGLEDNDITRDNFLNWDIGICWKFISENCVC